MSRPIDDAGFESTYGLAPDNLGGLHPYKIEGGKVTFIPKFPRGVNLAKVQLPGPVFALPEVRLAGRKVYLRRAGYSAWVDETLLRLGTDRSEKGGELEDLECKVAELEDKVSVLKDEVKSWRGRAESAESFVAEVRAELGEYDRSDSS